MFIRSPRSSSFFSFLIGGQPAVDSYRPNAGRHRMARYLGRWGQPRRPAAGRSDQNRSAAPEARAFILSDGRQLRSLEELRVALSELDESQFNFHAREGGGNDFARWLREVWREELAAELLERAQERREMERVLERLCRRRQ